MRAYTDVPPGPVIVVRSKGENEIAELTFIITIEDQEGCFTLVMLARRSDLLSSLSY